MLKTYKALVDFNIGDESYVAGQTYELADDVVATLAEGSVEEVAAPAADESAEVTPPAAD